jgi:hypothetical protein
LVADRDALFNRSQPVVFDADPEELWEWAVYLALTSNLTAPVTLRGKGGGAPRKEWNSLDVQSRALDWFTDNAPRLDVIGPRTLGQITQIMGRSHRGDMPSEMAEEELASLLLPTSRTGMRALQKSDWAALLRAMPKTPSHPVRLAA